MCSRTSSGKPPERGSSRSSRATSIPNRARRGRATSNTTWARRGTYRDARPAPKIDDRAGEQSESPRGGRTRSCEGMARARQQEQGSSGEERTDVFPVLDPRRCCVLRSGRRVRRPSTCRSCAATAPAAPCTSSSTTRSATRPTPRTRARRCTAPTSRRASRRRSSTSTVTTPSPPCA